MDAATIVTIVAILAGPILAVQAQKWIERLSQRHDEKRRVFMTLLTTKGRALAPEHVQALNGIHFFFRGKRGKDKAVVEAWDVYRDHLNNGVEEPKPGHDGQIPETEQNRYQSELAQWIDKGDDHLCTLLKRMAESLGYHFPDLLLKKGSYTPRGLGEVENNTMIILNGLAQILLGRRSLPMSVTETPTNEETSKAVIEFLQGKQTLPVRIEGSNEILVRQRDLAL